MYLYGHEFVLEQCPERVPREPLPVRWVFFTDVAIFTELVPYWVFFTDVDPTCLFMSHE